MLWQPINLTEACPAYSNLATCSYFGYIYLSLIVQLYGDNHDRKVQQKLCNGNKDNNNKGSIDKDDGGCNKEGDTGDEEYDFIVVGAGTAGCVVANRLTEVNNWKVLLLEAGPEQPDVTLVPSLSIALLGTNIDWKYVAQPDGKTCLARSEGRCGWPSGKMMGGTSSINSLLYVRGNKVDYDGWAAAGNDGWSYRDVLPYFKKSENNLDIHCLNPKYHGTQGEQYVSWYSYTDAPTRLTIEAFKTLGIPEVDFNGAHQFGTGQSQFTAKNGARVSAYTAFIQPIRYVRKNLTVKVQSEAVEIIINKNKKAYGIKYVRNGKTFTAIAKKEVIISAGTINSPKLLLLSGVGPKKCLEKMNIDVIKDLPVGQNLHDHVTFDGIVLALSNETATMVSNGEILKQVYDYQDEAVKTGTMSANGPFGSITFVRTDLNVSAPDVQLTFNGMSWRQFFDHPIKYFDSRVLPTVFYDALHLRVMNYAPKSRGRVLLNSTDPNGPPLIYPKYFSDERDLLALVKATKWFLSPKVVQTFESKGAYIVRQHLPACKEFLWGSDEYILCLARSYTTSSYHPVGTCKMGPKGDKTAVVDPRLKVRGIAGLRVIDASIMPEIPRANTNAPTLMVGEKGADMINKHWLSNYNKF